MLLELKVTDFAIIEKVHLNFRPGFNVLTGETGAGKSILLKSLALLMGHKGSGDVVRAGADAAVVEGLFDISQREDVRLKLEELGIDASDGIMVVRRVISGAGKNRIYINGTLNNLATLQSLMMPSPEDEAIPLVELTGQHENRNLLAKSYHLEILDYFAGSSCEQKKFGQQFQRLQSLSQEICRLEGVERERAKRVDFLSFQKNELAALNMCEGDEANLEDEYKRLKNSSKLLAFAEMAAETLTEGEDAVAKVIQRFLNRTHELEKLDSRISILVKPLADAKNLIEEAAYELRTHASAWERDPERFIEIETQMNRLRQLERKFGPTLSDVLRAKKDIEKELQELGGIDQRISELKMEFNSIKEDLEKRALLLHEVRVKKASDLAKAVNKELEELNMKGARLFVQVVKRHEMTRTGYSEVEFSIQNSIHDHPRAIAKVASGGELSRILLALKNVSGGKELYRTYLFDEVDSGVSGTTAERVGQKLQAMAASQQVICITHLPQVAALAKTHLLIQKSEISEGGVKVEVIELAHSARVRELARLISGEKITKSGVTHAEVLLRRPARKRMSVRAV